jgi:hypothetical protein
MIQNLCQPPVLLLGGLSLPTLVLASYAGFVAGQLCRRDRAADDGKELNRGAVSGLVGVVALLLALTLA